jgi:parvulin-like peptidyl-prolyl isomerase
VTQNGKTAIRPDLWDAIAKLQPGQHTDVITTSDGFYYIVQVEDRKKAAVTPLEDVRAQIEQTVISEQSQVRQQQLARQPARQGLHQDVPLIAVAAVT